MFSFQQCIFEKIYKIQSVPPEKNRESGPPKLGTSTEISPLKCHTARGSCNANMDSEYVRPYSELLDIIQIYIRGNIEIAHRKSRFFSACGGRDQLSGDN